MDKIKDHLRAYNKAKGWDVDDDSLQETLMDSDCIFRKMVEEHRWWNDWLYVVNIDGMLIGFIKGINTGDEDRGWEFEWGSVHEVKPKEETTTVYVPVDKD